MNVKGQAVERQKWAGLFEEEGGNELGLDGAERGLWTKFDVGDGRGVRLSGTTLAK